MTTRSDGRVPNLQQEQLSHFSSSYDGKDINAYDIGWRRQVRFFVIGVMKGGTTSMHRYTIQHPLVVRNNMKELRCLSAGNKFDPQDPYCESKYNLVELSHSPDYIVGDYSPGYIWSFPVTVPRIQHGFPMAKIIVLLRNPIDRLFSQHNMDLRNDLVVRDPNLSNGVVNDLEQMHFMGLFPFVRFVKSNNKNRTLMDWYMATIDKEHFSQFHGTQEEVTAWERYFESTHINLGIVSQGLYAVMLRAWIKAFTREKVLVLKTENMVDEEGVETAMRKVYKHVEIPYVPLEGNQRFFTGSYQQEEMDRVLNMTLQKMFTPFNEQLELLLGAKWKDSWW